MNKYVEPDRELNAFTCPYCKAFSNMVTDFVIIDSNRCLSLSSDNKLFIKDFNFYKNCNSKVTICNYCHNAILWVNDTIIYPKNIDSYIPNQDLSDEVKEIYNEASAIYRDSPRASCALLRLCLEKICIDLKCSPNDKLDNNILKLAKDNNLSERIIGVMEYVRITGNDAVHPNVIVNNRYKTDC